MPGAPALGFRSRAVAEGGADREESDGRINAAFDRINSRSNGEAMGMLPDGDFCAELSLATIGPMSGASQKGGGLSCVQRS